MTVEAEETVVTEETVEPVEAVETVKIVKGGRASTIFLEFSLREFVQKRGNLWSG